jgi:hypothetical protein
MFAWRTALVLLLQRSRNTGQSEGLGPSKAPTVLADPLGPYVCRFPSFG